MSVGRHPPLDAAPSLLERRRGLLWLTGREVARVLKLWRQTIAAPVISAFLFIVVFGLSLGGDIRDVHGFEYEVFIVPGLITMATVQAAYSNNASSVFQARFDRYIHDVLAAPMRHWEVNLGLSLGGVVRALLIGTGLVLAALAVTSVPVAQPLALVAAVALALTLFCSLGVVVGIYARSWDDIAFVQNIVIIPLSFLGGTFYSIDRLPDPWQAVSHANPLFYVIDAIRYGFLGTSDAGIWLSLAVIASIAAAMVSWTAYLFATGRRLKA
jgi:ABC-2 type transport system permease protein